MPSRNVYNIKSRVARILRDKGITSVDPEDYIDGINEAQNILSEMLKIFQKQATISSISGVQYYELPNDYMALIDKNSINYFDSDGNKHNIGLDEISNIKDTNDLYTKTGTPTTCWFEGNKLYLYPTQIIQALRTLK